MSKNAHKGRSTMNNSKKINLILVISGIMWGMFCGILAIVASELSEYLSISIPKTKYHAYNIIVVSVIFSIEISALILILRKIIFQKNKKIEIYKYRDQMIKIIFVSIITITTGFVFFYVGINEIVNIKMVDNSYLFILLISFFSYRAIILPHLFLFFNRN